MTHKVLAELEECFENPSFEGTAKEMVEKGNAEDRALANVVLTTAKLHGIRGKAREDR